MIGLTWYGKGTYLSLLNTVESERSSGLCEDLVETIILGTNRVYKPSTAFRRAVEAFASNLLFIANDKEIGYGYHSMKSEAFNGKVVGYKPFKAVMDGMYEFRFIEREKGFKEHTGRNAKAQAYRFRATDRLIEFALRYGITPANVGLHFGFPPRPSSIRQPVTLKTKRTFASEPRPMAISPDDDTAKQIAEQVNALNAFFAKQVITPNRHYAFTRIFANGDQPGTRWDQGGRLYSVGFGNYQQLPTKPKEDFPFIRADIRINGEATVELDIKASHLTILHAKKNIPLPNHPDPYTIIGFDRPVVKTFVTMTLGYDTFHKDWTKDAIKTFAKKSKTDERPEGEDLTTHSFNEVKQRTLSAIPLLSGWENSDIRWGDLQYVESEVIMATISELAFDHEVAALPVHDSIIVPISAQILATKVLQGHFERIIGVIPTIEAK